MKKLFGIALLLAGLILAISAGANFKYYEADRSMSVAIVADDNEFIDLTPLQPYAYLNNGKLTVEISTNNQNYNESLGFGTGLSPNTTYVFEEVFEVSNELWENNETAYPICVKISSNDGNLMLFTGDYNESAAYGTQLEFTVEHGSPVKIGMIFDNYGLGLGTHTAQMSLSADAGTCQT
ncbi:DUF1102 domain-containing protein [Geoglobus acetivorans]|uniref:DUF1102 domain-containing protein n=1 Tax=Geoglobus acetivorans TaxID=565033 RepID=A0A0A7GH91_GEOAI|nr:hypothetical protein GACE_2197 [Geoglobus acetivorans]